MFMWHGDVGIGGNAAKKLHSLRRRGVSRAFVAQARCEYDELFAATACLN
jgi:hypothetical protein